MERTDLDVDRFLAEAGEHAADLQQLDRTIGAHMTGLDRALWVGDMWGGTHQRIVGYGAIEQPRSRGATASWFLIGLARQSAHYSLYVNAVAEGRYLVQSRAKTLGSVKLGAAAVTFRTLADLDEVGLVALVGEARELTPNVR